MKQRVVLKEVPLFLFLWTLKQKPNPVVRSQNKKETLDSQFYSIKEIALGEIRTLNPNWASHFKCDSYTSSDTRAR